MKQKNLFDGLTGGSGGTGASIGGAAFGGNYNNFPSSSPEDSPMSGRSKEYNTAFAKSKESTWETEG